MWEASFESFPKRAKKKRGSPELINISESKIPEIVIVALEKGPEFPIQPAVRPVERIAMLRTVASRLREEQKPAYIDEAVRAVKPNMPRPKLTGVGSAISFFKRNELRLLMSAKTGVFVVLDTKIYREKAAKTIVFVVLVLDTREGGKIPRDDVEQNQTRRSP